MELRPYRASRLDPGPVAGDFRWARGGLAAIAVVECARAFLSVLYAALYRFELLGFEPCFPGMRGCYLMNGLSLADSIAKCAVPAGLGLGLFAFSRLPAGARAPMASRSALVGASLATLVAIVRALVELGAGDAASFARRPLLSQALAASYGLDQAAIVLAVYAMWQLSRSLRAPVVGVPHALVAGIALANLTSLAPGGAVTLPLDLDLVPVVVMPIVVAAGIALPLRRWLRFAALPGAEPAVAPRPGGSPALSRAVGPFVSAACVKLAFGALGAVAFLAPAWRRVGPACYLWFAGADLVVGALLARSAIAAMPASRAARRCLMVWAGCVALSILAWPSAMSPDASGREVFRLASMLGAFFLLSALGLSHGAIVDGLRRDRRRGLRVIQGASFRLLAVVVGLSLVQLWGLAGQTVALAIVLASATLATPPLVYFIATTLLPLVRATRSVQAQADDPAGLPETALAHRAEE